MSDIVQKLWGFCHTLRHDGVDYGAYIELLTYLLFHKMADERGVRVPEDCDWESLKAKSGTQLPDPLEVRLARARGQVEALTPALPPSPSYGGTGLARAFAGQLVPQDPTDEPAEKLLEQIRSPAKGKR
jgi:hypothetical protein